MKQKLNGSSASGHFLSATLWIKLRGITSHFNLKEGPIRAQRLPRNVFLRPSADHPSDASGSAPSHEESNVMFQTFTMGSTIESLHC